MRIPTVVLACCFLYAAPLAAETYSWTDDSGTVNFTEDYSSVPAKYRKKVNKRGDMGGQPASATPAKLVPPAADTTRKTTDGGGTGAVTADKNSNASLSPDTSYGGKALEEWKREFAALEAELGRLRAGMKEVEAERDKMGKGGFYSREKVQQLNESDKAAVDSYNKGVERYNQWMESAKKAGVPIEIRK